MPMWTATSGITPRGCCRSARGIRGTCRWMDRRARTRSEEHTSELQSLRHLVCRLLLEKRYVVEAARDHRCRANKGQCLCCLKLGPYSLSEFFFLNKRAPPNSSLLPTRPPSG